MKSVKGRERLSTVLAVAGVVLLLIGAFALYARAQLFDSDNFSKTAAKSLREEAVRDELAKPIVEQIINVGRAGSTCQAPIVIEDRCEGMTFVASMAKNIFWPEDMTTLTVFAALASAAIRAAGGHCP